MNTLHDYETGAEIRGATHAELVECLETARRKNMSHEPTLWGWCGETDNSSVTARGAAVVSRIVQDATGRQRVRLKRLARESKREQQAFAHMT